MSNSHRFHRVLAAPSAKVFPAFIPPEQCVVGRRQSPYHPIALVEPDIPN